MSHITKKDDQLIIYLGGINQIDSGEKYSYVPASLKDISLDSNILKNVHTENTLKEAKDVIPNLSNERKITINEGINIKNPEKQNVSKNKNVFRSQYSTNENKKLMLNLNLKACNSLEVEEVKIYNNNNKKKKDSLLHKKLNINSQEKKSTNQKNTRLLNKSCEYKSNYRNHSLNKSKKEYLNLDNQQVTGAKKNSHNNDSILKLLSEVSKKDLDQKEEETLLKDEINISKIRDNSNEKEISKVSPDMLNEFKQMNSNEQEEIPKVNSLSFDSSKSPADNEQKTLQEILHAQRMKNSELRQTLKKIEESNKKLMTEEEELKDKITKYDRTLKLVKINRMN